MDIYYGDNGPVDTLKTVIRILLLHVGGTFGMIGSDRGYVTAPGQLEDKIRKNGFLNRNCSKKKDVPLWFDNPACVGDKVIKYDFKEFPVLKDSTEASPRDVIEIVKAIREDYDKYDGFVIIHGTDTMSYVGSAVSFMIRNLQKPIVFTGSMVPMSERGTDAVGNLNRVFNWFLKHHASPGVYLIFNKQRMLIEHAYKFDAHRKNAFRSISPDLKENGCQASMSREVSFLTEIADNIEIIKVSPFSSQSGVVLNKALESSRGVVIEGYGDGNIPDYCVEIIKKYPHIPVVVVTQCRLGRINGDYECGRKLQKCPNIIFGSNMTSEAAVSRLAVFVEDGNNKNIRDIRELFESCESYGSNNYNYLSSNNN